MIKKSEIVNLVQEIGAKAKAASFKIASLTSKMKNEIIKDAAQNLKKIKIL